jgi:hypothetical protein
MAQETGVMAAGFCLALQGRVTPHSEGPARSLVCRLRQKQARNKGSTKT